MTDRESTDLSAELPPGFAITDEDILKAMKRIQGYLDITPEDFRELFRVAWHLALQRLAGSIRAADIMTGDVVAVPRTASLREVAELMAQRGVAGVPVLEDDGSVAGIITERDFLSQMGESGTKSFMGIAARCLAGKGCVAAPIRAKKAEDIMTSPVVTITPEMVWLDIAGIFKEKKINRAPVVDVGGRLLGIVSREDIVHTPIIGQLS